MCCILMESVLRMDPNGFFYFFFFDFDHVDSHCQINVNYKNVTSINKSNEGDAKAIKIKRIGNVKTINKQLPNHFFK